MDLNMDVVIKEPRGFIRVVQLILAICAFATTCGYSGFSALDIFCPEKEKASEIKTHTFEYPIEYPFKLDETEFKYISNCSADFELSKTFPMDFSSSAKFYVTTGVLCMMYCVGALAFYVLSATVYSTNPLIPVIDLIVTGIFTIFWFAGSCAWAAGVSDLKYYTNPVYLRQYIPVCKERDMCDTNKVANWSSLNISLIFGFLNCFVWGASLWFVFKETHFHTKQSPAMMPPGSVPPQTSFGGYGEPIGQQARPQYPNAQQPPVPPQPQQYTAGSY
ncbi:synaptophysin-like protein 1 [Brevipalpus obovatus]|uniref:synaptophysin-like protein 1 n=1 Tax=Brevipalpus obovatus TaxID=246614 RepID=UPI003D9EBBA5